MTISLPYIEPFVVDTRFTGSDLYSDSFQEVGVDIGPDISLPFVGSQYRIGVKYLHASNQTGFMAHFGLWF